MPDVLQQIAELRRKIESLELLHSTLGENAYQKAKANLEYQLEPLISTAGGTALLGDVTVDRNSKLVVGDDYSQTIVVTSQRMLSELQRARPPSI